MKLLVLGFSVTAQKNGYCQYLESPDGWTVVSQGFGGLHPQNISTLTYRSDLTAGYDCVIFEIMTSSFRGQLSVIEFMRHIARIVGNTAQTTPQIGFLILPRRDLPDLDWHRIALKVFCKVFRIPYLDVSGNNEWFDDLVHSNEIGSKAYAENANKLVNICVGRGKVGLFAYVRRKIPRRRIEIVQANSSRTHSQYLFARSGAEEEMIELEEGEWLLYEVEPGHTGEFELEIVIWPDGGKLELLGKGDRVNLLNVDSYAYYNRFSLSSFKLNVGSTIAVSQSPERVDVVTNKGSLSDGPRKGFVGNLYVKY